MNTHDSSKNEELFALLKSLFDQDQLHQFIRFNIDNGADVWDSLPLSTPFNNVAFKLVDELEKRGLIMRELFVSLCKVRGGRVDRICEVYEALFNHRLTWSADNASKNFKWSQFVDMLSGDLVSALDRCATVARVRNFDTISTSEVFHVYGEFQPWVKVAFPDKAFKQLKPEPDKGHENIFESNLGGSRCVQLSMQGLVRHTPLNQQLSFHDLFFDLARFGAGGSVGRLRNNEVFAARINEISAELKIGRLTRHGLLESQAVDQSDI